MSARKKYYVCIYGGTITAEYPRYGGYTGIYITYDRDLALGICEDVRKRKVEDAEEELCKARAAVSEPCKVEVCKCDDEPKRWWRKS